MKKFKQYNFKHNGVDFLIKTNDPAKAEAVKNEIITAVTKNSIYCNDLTAELWQFDTKLNCGAWLENIHPTNDLKTVRALILF